MTDPDTSVAAPVQAVARGRRFTGQRRGNVFVFQGIRYGLPPVGEHRFAPPRPAPAGDVDARLPGPDAWQVRRPAMLVDDGPPRPMDEDVLHLGVWTPALPAARDAAGPGLPVLVHLFGGGFQGGSASDPAHDAAALAARTGAVVVRIGFRIGAPGFLWLGDEVAADRAPPGNPGLLDAALALEWVRDHIAGFGGDPARVTVFGLSSGAFMIGALLAMPRARACFAQAWMQSGSASRILSRRQAAALTRALFDRLGLAPGDLDGLNRVPPEALLAAQDPVLSTDLGDRNGPDGRTFGVVLDGRTLPRHPLDAVADGELAGHRLFLMSTRDEARMWFDLGLMRPVADEAGLAAEIGRYLGAARAPAVLAAYRTHLPGAGVAAWRAHFLTQAIYRLPALRTALAQARAGGRAWLARFDWQPDDAGGRFRRFGAAHAFDEPFVWGCTDPTIFRYLDGPAEVRAGIADVSDALVDTLRRLAHGGEPGWPAVRDGGECRVFGARPPADGHAAAEALEAALRDIALGGRAVG